RQGRRLKASEGNRYSQPGRQTQEKLVCKSGRVDHRRLWDHQRERCLSGTATASGVTGSGKVGFTANLSPAKSCLTQLRLTNFALAYKHLDVKIDGLGIFNDLLEPVVDVISLAFGTAISSLIAGALVPVLNDLMNGELSFACQSTRTATRRTIRSAADTRWLRLPVSKVFSRQ
ncbi:MAG TPA: hypothetical protein VFV34_21950, partial [Blastocatellia bacterium]|nr:hypothetical protein [Blastocatellia bacterium]